MMIDTYEKLDIGLDRIDQILHVADIHIRLTKRHDEYREAFQKVYDAVDKLSQHAVVAVLGDIVHSKCDLSPEAVQLASEFLRNLADRRPTILIAGNHDSLLTNKTRLDSLSPIVDNLKHKNLFYLKESKLYGAANVLFNNCSIFDDPSDCIKIKNVTKRLLREFDTTIALFHGPVHGAMTDIGFSINNRSVTTETFLGHDIALLGDIHLAQTLQGYDPVEEMPIIRFAGSLIQQNHGEALKGHGYSLWDVAKRTFVHTEIPNDYGYFTILIDNGKLATDITEMPLKAKLRVNCRESVATEVKKVITEIRKTHQISDIVYVRVDPADSKKTAASKTASNLSQIGSVDYQNQLITTFLKGKFPEMDDDTLASVHSINQALNSVINKDDQSRNIRWKPKRFEFDNMFSYGEGNVVDFTKLNDVFGLFAANASGKSSLMDALSFTVFDKSAKAFKAAHVINSQKMSFKGKFRFEINGTDYVIERSGARDKKGNVKVEVNFYKLDGDNQVPLNAEARRSTNEIIRDYLGTYDDFILTALSLQSNEGSFVDMGQTERKELLCQFIGITLFDRLSSAANDRIKEVSGALKTFNKEDNTMQLARLETEQEALGIKIADVEQQNDQLSATVADLNGQINIASQEIVNLMDVPSDPEPIRKELSDLSRKIEGAQPHLIEMRAKLDELKAHYEEQKRRLTELESLDLDDKANRVKSGQRQKLQLDHELDNLKTIVKEKIKKLEHLDKHEYDPNCKFCVNNVFVKDAIATRESLKADKDNAKELMRQIAEVSSQLDELMPFKVQYDERGTLRTDVSNHLNVISKKQMELTTAMSLLERMSSRVTKIGELLSLYDRSKEIVEKNDAISNTVNSLKSKLRTTESTLKDRRRELTTAVSRRTSVTDQITSIRGRITQMEEYESEYAAYEYYLNAIGPSGVPYQIISDAIPQIESEVNNILSQIVEFTMNIETDGKNVNVFIKYEDRKWPLELCSGMEKFIAGLALRVALINVSNLPRPNFLVVDEGFGALDADNMGTMHSLFDFLKSNFEFIIIISHLDAMRDMVDKQLEIRKENGFSKIDNSAS